MYQAIDSLNRGINKGGVQDADEAQISLGIAYLKLDLKDLANEAFPGGEPRLQVGAIGGALDIARGG